ncbi:MAG: acyl-ACP--UDP-N-acetylglucosamine O-acyltransferase [Syntrophobacterales bacterium]|nr:acyl-ACP--UDP-N-acetylglucosamine O-acyltransferase [Syntrophobacterales bacterium]
MSQIHPTAVVHRGAEIGEGTIIEPYVIIGPEVKIGKGNRIGAHTVIEGRTTIGEGNTIFPFVSIGLPPQDISYRDEPTEVVIGNRNIIREGVTIHRGTIRGTGLTKIGDDNYLMAYSHVAHDCVIGNHVILANCASLAGHVIISDYAVIGGLVGVHQFVRIGKYAFIGGLSGISMDIPPFMIAAGDRAKLYGPNIVGLRRAGFSPETIMSIKRAYKILFRSGLTLQKAINKLRGEKVPSREVEELIEFMEAPSKRGVTR